MSTLHGESVTSVARPLVGVNLDLVSSYMRDSGI